MREEWEEVLLLINVSSGSTALNMSINRQQKLGFFLNRTSNQLLASI
jgi:hypothetical protein